MSTSHLSEHEVAHHNTDAPETRLDIEPEVEKSLEILTSALRAFEGIAESFEERNAASGEAQKINRQRIDELGLKRSVRWGDPTGEKFIKEVEHAHKHLISGESKGLDFTRCKDNNHHIRMYRGLGLQAIDAQAGINRTYLAVTDVAKTVSEQLDTARADLLGSDINDDIVLAAAARLEEIVPWAASPKAAKDIEDLSDLQARALLFVNSFTEGISGMGIRSNTSELLPLFRNPIQLLDEVARHTAQWHLFDRSQRSAEIIPYYQVSDDSMMTSRKARLLVGMLPALDANLGQLRTIVEGGLERIMYKHMDRLTTELFKQGQHADDIIGLISELSDSTDVLPARFIARAQEIVEALKDMYGEAETGVAHEKSVEAHLSRIHEPYTVKRAEIKSSGDASSLVRQIVRGDLGAKSLPSAISKDEAYAITGVLMSLQQQLELDEFKSVFDAFFAAIDQEAELDWQGYKGNGMPLLQIAARLLLEDASRLHSVENCLTARVMSQLGKYLHEIRVITDPDLAAADETTVTVEPGEGDEFTEPEFNELQTEDLLEDEMESDELPHFDSEITAALSLIERFKQLDIRAFPPSVKSMESIVTDIGELEEKAGKKMRIERERIAALLQLAENIDGQGNFAAELFRLLPGSLQETFPYYAAVITTGERKIVIAENPRYGNATYIFEEIDPELISWQEMIQLDKKSVRELGGKSLRHTSGSITEHYDRVTESLITRIISGMPL